MLEFPFRRGNHRAGRNHHGHPNSEADREKASSPPQGARGHPFDREESNELEAGLRRIGCLVWVVGEILES